MNKKEINYKYALKTILKKLDDKNFNKKACKIFITSILIMNEIGEE